MAKPSIFAHLLRTAAKAGTAGADGFARRNAAQAAAAAGKPTDPNAGCTPCAAMARVRNAKAFTGSG